MRRSASCASRSRNTTSRLAEAESRLAEFKKGNIGLVPGAQGDYFSRLQGETDAAQRVEAQLRVASQRRAELGRQLSGERPFVGGALSSPALVKHGGADRARRRRTSTSCCCATPTSTPT